jgi:MFS family permease
MNVYWFGLAFMWNGLHPIILPALLLRFVPDALKNTYLGAMNFLGLILAMIVQPLAGALSDRSRSRWGRRRPWIVGGVAVSLALLAGMALAQGYWGLFLAYALLQISSNTAHGPAQGLIPDLVPQERRGVASGIKNLFDMGGMVVASLVAGQLMGHDGAGFAFVVTGAVLVASTLVTVLGTKEQPASAPAEESAAGESLREVLRVDLRRHPDFAWLVASRFMILLGIYVVQAFAQYYVRDYLHVANPAEVTGNLMAVIGLALTALVFPAGILSDRFGRKPLNYLAGGLAALGILLIVFARSIAALLAFGSIVGMATGVFVSVNWALATDLIPHEEAAKYLGLTNLATAGAGALARVAGPLIDGLNALRPGAYLGYPVLFALASACTLAGTFLLLRVRVPARG